jgi:hypothetical protein
MLCEQSHPSTDNVSCSAAISSENIQDAMELMKQCLVSESPVKMVPPIRIMPPMIYSTETKYWIPYGNVAVPVYEDIEYKFVHRLQGYLRDKRQNVESSRLIRL